MPGYRLYLLDPHSGHIDGVEEFHSADDAEAICMATQREREVPGELWCGARKVTRLDDRPPAAAALPQPARAGFPAGADAESG